MTLSEQLFERFCDQHRIRFRRIPETSARTPDYEILVARRKIVVEVKEISPNKEELNAQASARVGKFIVVSSTPGERIRGKISDAVPQLKAATKGRLAGLLVLLDTGFAADHTNPYNVRVAMFGLETHYLGVPQDPRQSVYLIDKDFGSGRKTTPNHNTSLSAIAVLGHERDTPTMLVYHNPYARVPLPASSFAKYNVQQFRLQSKSPGQFPNWQKL